MVDETQSEKMRMGQSKRRPQHDYYLAGNNLQDSVCEKDLHINIVPNLSPESPIRTAEKNCLLANVRIAFKYLDSHGGDEYKDMFTSVYWEISYTNMSGRILG